MPELRPVTQADAFAFVREHHRHHDVPVGALWQHGAHDDDGSLCGVAVVGRPVARKLEDGLTCEVTRLCTDGTYNACSLLYAAARRVAIDKGYRRGISYILESEDGASLRAAGLALPRKDQGRFLGSPVAGPHRQGNDRAQATIRLGSVARVRQGISRGSRGLRHIRGDADMPIRIQRKRAKGWRMPEGTVYVGRGSKWGNPFNFANTGAVHPALRFACEVAPLLDVTELRGKDLACWCAPNQPCHADTLLELANR